MNAMVETVMASFVRTKRVYEKPEPCDGIRVLVTQYWPRGVPRESVGEYVRALAPSRELLHAYRSGQVTWEQYRERFLAEMRGESQMAELHRLAKIARSEVITLLCVCDEEEKCHRWLLQTLVSGFNEDQ